MKSKKLISGVLAFTLLSITTVSGVFANRSNEKNVETIISLAEKANKDEEKQIASKLESVLQTLLEQNGKLSPSQHQKCVSELLSLIDDANKIGNKQMSESLQMILNDILNENEDQNGKIQIATTLESITWPKQNGKLSPSQRQELTNELLDLIDTANKTGNNQLSETLQSILNDILNENQDVKESESKTQNDNQNKLLENESSKMSTGKKVLIATVVIGLFTICSYLTYAYAMTPILTFINNNIITSIAEKSSPYIDKALNILKSYIAEPTKSVLNNITDYFNTEGTWGHALLENFVVSSITDKISDLFKSKDK